MLPRPIAIPSRPGAPGRSALAALGGAATLALALSITPAMAASHAGKHVSKAVTVRLTAAATGAANGFNFNGYAKGQMTVTVPLGARVTVIFQNKSTSIPHSVLIVPWAQRASTTLSPAFPGATLPNATSGITGGPPQRFSFTASKQGKYAIVCGVPGHAASGMWDVFLVKKGAAYSIKHA